MADYFCVLHRPGSSVPTLRFLDCSGDEDTPAHLVPLIREWPDIAAIDVFDGERLVTTLTTADLAVLGTCSI